MIWKNGRRSVESGQHQHHQKMEMKMEQYIGNLGQQNPVNCSGWIEQGGSFDLAAIPLHGC